MPFSLYHRDIYLCNGCLLPKINEKILNKK